MPALNYTTTLVAGANENVNDVQTLFNEVREVINGLDNDNIAAAAGIVYSKLSLAGSIKNADIEAAAGIDWSKIDAASGAVAISSSGVTTLDYEHTPQSGTFTLSKDDSTFQTVATVTPGAGTWLVFGKIWAAAQSNAQAKVTGRLRQNSSDLDYAQGFISDNVFQASCSIPLMTWVQTDGDDTVTLAATSLQGTGTGALAQYGRLTLIRIA